VIIQKVAREPGFRSKIAVISKADGVDPVGACVGPRGSRVRMVVSELRGEKIDIIPYNDEPARFVAKALAPARVKEVYVYDEERLATVIVPEEQLSVAIGREGQNAKLAGRLTGWHIEIKSEAEWREAESERAQHGDDDGSVSNFSGRCMAVDARGKRCVNAALPQSYYCGLPAHQALATEGAPVGVEGQASTEEVSTLPLPSSAAPPPAAGGDSAPEADDSPAGEAGSPTVETPVADDVHSEPAPKVEDT